MEVASARKIFTGLDRFLGLVPLDAPVLKHLKLMSMVGL
jgi:hypothetical protein